MRGELLDESNEEPVPEATLTLRSRDGEEVAQAVSDSAGHFALPAPGPGEYRIEAVRIGYEELRTPLLRLDGEEVPGVEILLRPLPVPLEGFDVVGRATEQHLSMLGLRAEDLGNRLVTRDEIEDVPARHLGDVLRHQNIAGLNVIEPEQAVGQFRLCLALRRARRGNGKSRCALVVLNGQVVSGDLLELVPPEFVETIVVLHPVQAARLYGTLGGAGAVLLFLRTGR